MTNRYRRDKFAELVLLIASESTNDTKFGEVKLHKLLYFSDFRAYARWGESITGARYMRNRYGPTARVLGHVLDELEGEGRASIETADYYGHPQRRVVPKDAPRKGMFSGDEIDLVSSIIDEFRDVDATEISNVSHVAPGWQIARDREDIPYFTVLIDPQEPPPEIKREAAELAQHYGWLSRR